METVAEIQDMRVTELKEFLKRNEFDVSSIQRADGTDGPPRKSDLASAALHLRADYDNPKEDGPLSPSRKSNVFQSGYSPRSPAVQRTKTSPRRGGESSGSEDMNPRRRPGRPAKRPSAVVGTAAAASSSAKKLKPRRRSASWINPAFNLTPGGGTPRKAFTPGRVARRVEVTEQVEEFPVESNEDQLLPSDYDSSGGGLSGVESDGGSVIDTDDDDDSQPNKFRSMKVYEIRAWLNKHDVVFNHRSKKAELISLATGHALYLENMEDKATTRSAAKKDWREVEDDDITAAQDDDEVVEVTPAKDSRRYPARKSVETRPTPKSSKKADEVVARSREDSAYRRSRNRVIAAPQPDEDMIEKAEKKPVDDDIVEMKKVKKMKKRHQKKERPAKKRWFRLPTLKMPAMPTMPKITITRRGVLFFLGAIVAALLGFVIFTAYEKSTWPYCDTGSNQGVMPDGRECHPCPPRGRCEKGQLTCMKGYFQSGKRCVEDQEVSRYAVFLEARLLDYMQQIKGQHLCKNTSPTIEVGQLHAMGSPVKDDDRPSANRRPKRHQFSPSKFDAAFMLALASLKKNHRDEVTYDPVNETFEAVEGRREFKCIANQFLMAHIGKLFILLVIAILIGKWKFQSYFRKREETQIENCYQEAVEVLRELRVNFNDDEKGDAFMIDTQLREEILGRTTNEKVKLWAKVEKLLRADSRVFCAGPRSIKGMPCYTYEWRGNLRRPSLSRSASRDGFRGYDPDTESKRRLSFGAGSRRQSSAFDAGSPTGTPSGSPTLDPVSPGYRNMLNFWNR